MASNSRSASGAFAFGQIGRLQSVFAFRAVEIIIRLETVRCLQEVTCTDLAEREYGDATSSRGLIGPKKRQNTKGTVFLVAVFPDPFSALLLVFFSVRPSVHHSGTALALSRAFERSSWPGRISSGFANPAARRKQCSPNGLDVRFWSA